MGRIIRAYRHHPWHPTRLSQDLVARWGHTAQATLSRMEKARAAPQDLGVLTLWSRTLRIPPEHLWYRVFERGETAGATGRQPPGSGPITTPVPSQRRITAPDPESPTGTLVGPEGVSPTLGEILDSWDELMRRRDLLIVSGAATPVVLTPVLPEFLARVSPAASEAYAAHEALRAVHGRLDNLYGAAAVFRQVHDHHRELTAWHQAAATDSERRRVASLTADTSGLMGWLLYDLGRYNEAARLYRQAAEIAADAGDASLCANNIGQMSRTLSECGNSREALTFANAAIQVAGTRAHPQLRSWLHAVRAWHHACLGERRECQSDLDRAGTLLAQVHEPGPRYVGYMDEAELRKWTGHCYVRLATTNPVLLRTGSDAIDSAHAAWPASMVRGSAEVLVTRAAARIAQQEVEHAASLTRQAHEVATATGSVRNLGRVTGLRRQLRPYRDTPAVRELDDYLVTEGR